MLRIEVVPRANRLALPGQRGAAPQTLEALLRHLAGDPSAGDGGDGADEGDTVEIGTPPPMSGPTGAPPDTVELPHDTIEIAHDTIELPHEPAESEHDTVEIGTPPPIAGPTGAAHETSEISTPPAIRGDDDRSAAAPRRRDARVGVTLQERLRKLTPAAQRKLARTGELTERVALERIFGKSVWEPLLRNPKLTPPEVARIARMGTLPVPLIELIVGNKGWLTSGQVRRALLANRRLRGALIHQVLRATPRAELKIMPKQTAYPSAVRNAAAAMLR